jgi:hypothetical protein
MFRRLITKWHAHPSPLSSGLIQSLLDYNLLSSIMRGAIASRIARQRVLT